MSDTAREIAPYAIRNSEIDWVDPAGQRRAKATHPYSYDPFFLLKSGDVRNAESVYSDRLAQWDFDAYRAACTAIGKRLDQCSLREVSKFMAAYFGDRKINAIALAEGCNQSSGNPYWIIWFRELP